MGDSGTGSGPELLLALSRGGGVPLHVQLEGALREAVRSGRLAPGERLPASRVLANDLGVSRRMVVEAYAQLAAEGYLSARPGSATRVSDVVVPAAAQVAVVRGPAESQPRWDLRPGLPSFAHFPRREWRRALQGALAEAENAEFGYPEHAGHWRLREVLAGYLNRVRGVAAEPGDVLVCNGFTQALDLVCRALREAGARAVALEDRGLPHRIPIIERAGLIAVPVGVDAEGLRVDELPDGVGAVLTTPAHQFPSGWVLAPRRREALMAWAARTGAVVVEDDYDGEFRFDRRAVGSLQGRAPESVIYVGTASKTLAPALRLGWMVAPGYLMERLVRGKFYADAGNALLDQLALAEMITSGAYDRHVRQSRARYRDNRQALQEAITRHGVPLELAGVPAGLQTLATLPDGLDAEALVERAGAEGVGLMSVARFEAVARPRADALVLGYGNITPAGIDQAVEILGQIVSGKRYP
ncbi:PLP-dependent aminotransferase family protein [Actinomadura barringtoniae]|uniref:PLP-dependent aminotransferase family protein n=1 Tax=Actinomadura barringtoniae TaxID=1427535 RepID=A0A939PM65_9ACTN|nr:PLP-dependent aminotransferase family protein [Actinomadura barringtoniae]MBO2451714.1 PLP-dependent aminotransferase family protein [Actinomadura barringtoniae]